MATAKKNNRPVVTFTATVDGIKEHKNMFELKLVHSNQPPERWYSAKLFKEAKALATGELFDTSDPFADPDSFAASKVDKIKLNDLITIRTTSEPKQSQPLEKDLKTPRKTWNGKKVVKTTFNLNRVDEIQIRSRG